MNDDIARVRLAAAPAHVRAEMMARRDDLPAGAVTAVGRFFTILSARGEHPSAPSRVAFEQACASESTLALLLRVLGEFAPEVCLAEGRDLRRAHYRRRPGGSEDPNRKTEPARQPAGAVPRNWPAHWLALLPGLRAAPIKESSINRHIASVNRCADLVPQLKCPPRLGWLLAWELAQEAQRARPGFAKCTVSARTAATYLGGLISLGLHGGLDRDALAAMRAVQAHLLRQGRRLPKKKDARINALYEKGGYDEIMRTILRKLEEAEALSAWSAAAATRRATAAILAVCTNDPARTGDVAAWVLGEALVREPAGTWWLRWRQEKTGYWKEAGALWPEIGHVLDEHLLGGRPCRQVQHRYEELRGRNWLSFTDQAYDRRWPSQRVSEAVGVPLHDLRTLIADYMRLHDPVSAPGIIRVVLGQRTLAAGKEYTALSAETAAQRSWQAIRAVHAGGRVSPGKSRPSHSGA